MWPLANSLTGLHPSSLYIFLQIIRSEPQVFGQASLRVFLPQVTRVKMGLWKHMSLLFMSLWAFQARLGPRLPWKVGGSQAGGKEYSGVGGGALCCL